MTSGPYVGRCCSNLRPTLHAARGQTDVTTLRNLTQHCISTCAALLAVGDQVYGTCK